MTGLEEWLDQHLPPPDSLDALAIFTDTRPLDQIGAWKHRERLWCHRFSRVGPCNERWQGLFAPLTTDTGLAEVHCTWGGVFVAETIAATCVQPGTCSFRTRTSPPRPSLKSKSWYACALRHATPCWKPAPRAS